MKTKFLIISLLIIATLSSCQKDELEPLNDNECNEMLYFESIEEYTTVSNQVANMSKTELHDWEKEQGIVSFGIEAQRIYDSFETENFESIEDVKKKLLYDLYYFENMSFFLDIQILIRTIWVVITGSGAQ